MKENVYFYLINGHILMQSNISDINYIKDSYNCKKYLSHKIFSINRISSKDYYYLLSKIQPNKFQFNYLD